MRELIVRIYIFEYCRSTTSLRNICVNNLFEHDFCLNDISKCSTCLTETNFNLSMLFRKDSAFIVRILQKI